MTKKILALTMALLMTIGILAGCSAQPKDDRNNAGTTIATASAPAEPTIKKLSIDKITIGTTSAIETATREEYAYDMLASAVSEIPLVYQDTNGDFHPMMAEYTTEDSLTWTYTIVDGMTWSDGEKVTAEDILFTMQYEDAAGGANFVTQTDSDGKTTKAKYTAYDLSDDKMSISLTLASPNVRALSNMTSFRVMPKHIYEGNENLTQDDQRVGCGPYRFESFNKESGTLTFVADPNFPETPKVATIIYQIFNNEDTMYMALQSGDIDMVWNYSQGVSANYQDALAGSDTVTLENVAAANAPAVLAFNNANGIFSDKNLRKAVSYALDYNAFKTYFGSDYSQIPNSGFVPKATVGYKETAALETNLEKAEQYVKEAGYTQKNDEGFYVDGNGNVLGFTLTVNADKTPHVGCAELIKTNLEEFGIQVTLDTVDKASYNAKTSNKFSENHITMEAAIYGYTAAGMGMGNGMASIYVDGTHPVQGGAQVFDEHFQSIVAEMSAAKNLDEYKTAAGKIQDFYSEETPIIALYWDNMMYAHASKFENMTIDYTFGLNNAMNWFTITEK